MGDEYSVYYWGSHPDAGNDDCDTGFHFNTLAEAKEQFNNNDPRYTSGRPIVFWRFVEIDGPDLNEVRPNPGFDEVAYRREQAAYEAAERSERAMQAGMAFGCQGYNEAMGYDVETE